MSENNTIKLPEVVVFAGPNGSSVSEKEYIIGDRIDECLQDVADKVYTRDWFGQD